MAGRGKLIAVLGDEDTVTGFLLGGVGELNKHRKPNFLVVEKDTSLTEIEETFRWGGRRGTSRHISVINQFIRGSDSARAGRAPPSRDFHPAPRPGGMFTARDLA
uniref:ATPase H+ transporting V1 subunit F n=1 Tax=Chelonoidis abingdonii TaxID=106734 RepID=A0A8C0G455_CHEAB